MGSSRGLPVGLALRTGALAGALLLAVLAFQDPDLAAARLVAAALAAAAGWALWRHVDRTDREAARFVEALRHGDLAQGFGARGRGGRLAAALDGAMRDLRAERALAADERSFHAGLAEEAPAALLLVDGEGRVTLANKAARRLFAQAEGARPADFARFGEALATGLAPGQPPFRRLAALQLDGAAARVVMTRSEVTRGAVAHALVAVQPIQAELSAVELAAQADLVRVLTHEIMNSLTPVVSLAGTAAALVAEVDDGRDPRLADARLAAETLAGRAEGIMRFVESYRAFSRPPAIRTRRFAAGDWAEGIARLFRASAEAAGAALAVKVAPAALVIDADPDLLAQVVLNLLKNGAEAAGPAARLDLSVAALPGGRARIRVADDGPGVPPALAGEIFLPFFTTKPAGTGVGLSLARRIAAAHGGSLTLAPCERGACFDLVV